MKFNDIYFNKKYLFSIGKTSSGVSYISVPVTNRRVDYEEYYEIDEKLLENFDEKIEFLRALADSCRRRERDGSLIMASGRDRGVPMWPDSVT